MAIKLDIKKGSSITRDKDGWNIQRMGLLTYDLTDPLLPSVDAILHAAATDGTLPALGDPHPSIATVFLERITAEPLSAGKYSITLTYTDAVGFPGTSNIAKRVNATTALDQTGVDKNGTAMSTVYRTQNDIDNSWFSYEFFTADIERPRATIEFEYTVTGAYPSALIDTYLGKLNSVTWNGYAVETVMCSDIRIQPQGEDWRVSIAFVYSPQGWEYTAQIAAPIDHVVTFTDATLNTTTGRKTFDIYQTVDFTPLGLAL